ncbi:hypothetical protein BCV72DRAFT_239114 [Rhizopus microsporus var. microsporus]|uniref:Membrane anchor Opy2 N-terminal domain-containing protein n=2 Tax=Rhizopus microsporus TaxID=58291 RepID=A0A2G4ST24_RHIZD|nr:uncharacterized protein RHIMIDRAFT_244355 [Rhizopus microsporus ATCC 52813]ORE10078.1 hypothetical protein BCV72DRAFT_239114 [Rhizopus microsporus var. microsporus]PHZ11910.1 hypothetical protein RHIMIDRAFT_244355 [Rhizopus microsporus ATCC 52813]
MKNPYIIVAIAAFLIAFVCAAEDDNSKPTGIHTAPGIVCPMTVCPTNTLSKRDKPACPVSCPDNCRIIDDDCCPGVQKAVCYPASASQSHSAVPTSASSAITSAVPTASSASVSSAASTVVPSASASSTAPSAPVSPAASSPSPSAANSIQLTISTSIIAAIIVAGLQCL